MKKIKIFLTIIICLGVFSCSSPSMRESRLDVRPGVDGVHRVVVITKNQVEGSREALNQADQYCKEIKKSAYFFNSPTNDNAAVKPKAQYSSSAPAKKTVAAADDADAEKTLTIDMLFKCL